MYRILAATFLALALASPATAKEIEQVKACGEEGCHTTKGVGMSAHGLIPPDNAAQLVPFYRLSIGIGDGSGQVFDTIKVLWAPRTGMIANDETQPLWVPADLKTQRLARRLTKGLVPFPAAEMPIALPPAQVDETVTPAVVAAATTGGGGPPWAILAGGVLAGLGAAALLVRPARRRAASKAARRAFQPPSPGRG